jgi:hypothetical protein
VILLRVVVAAGPVLAMLATGPRTGLPPVWLLLLVAALAVGHAALPESDLGTAAMLGVVAWWGLGPVSDVAPPPSALLAAAALTLSHVAAVLLAYGPSARSLDRGVLRVWLGRAGLMVLAGAVVWLGAVAAEGRPAPSGLWESGLVVVVLGAVLAGGLFSPRPARPAGPAPSGRSRPAE